SGLDRRHELLLAVPEGRPVELDVHLALLGPRFDVPGEDVVAIGDEALEQPDAHLRLALGVRHAGHHLQTDRSSAGDRGGTTKEFPARDRSGIELLGKGANPLVHSVSSSWRWSEASVVSYKFANKSV